MYLLHEKNLSENNITRSVLVERKNLFRKNISKNDRFRRWANITWSTNKCDVGTRTWDGQWERLRPRRRRKACCRQVYPSCSTNLGKWSLERTRPLMGLNSKKKDTDSPIDPGITRCWAICSRDQQQTIVAKQNVVIRKRECRDIDLSFFKFYTTLQIDTG